MISSTEKERLCTLIGFVSEWLTLAEREMGSVYDWIDTLNKKDLPPMLEHELNNTVDTIHYQRDVLSMLQRQVRLTGSKAKSRYFDLTTDTPREITEDEYNEQFLEDELSAEDITDNEDYGTSIAEEIPI